ncbi:MAG TPA: response regulator [Acidimicrobiales bacterium]|jgi:DNA-binding response OmpR family regulator
MPARVLVVNDDPDILEVVARALESAGHAVSRCPDHDAAVGAVGVSAPDIVVIDLPGSGAGVGLLESLRTRPEATVRDTRVLVIGSGPANATAAWQAGADGFLVRPFHARELAAQVDDIVARPDLARATHRATQLAALAH